jgi:hypothetical protein
MLAESWPFSLLGNPAHRGLLPCARGRLMAGSRHPQLRGLRLGPGWRRFTQRPRRASPPRVDPIPDSAMVPAVGARLPPRRGEGGRGIRKSEVVATVGIEPTARGCSVQGRGVRGHAGHGVSLTQTEPGPNLPGVVTREPHPPVMPVSGRRRKFPIAALRRRYGRQRYAVRCKS